MDSKYKGIAWVADIRQKFETLCLEVDDVMHEETFNHVDKKLVTVGANIENQLQTMGNNIKRFCSGFVQDVLPAFSLDPAEGATPDLSLQQNKNTDLAALESSKVGVESVDIVPKKGLCNKNSSAHLSFVEPVEGVHIDSLSKQHSDIGMCEKLNFSVMENAIVEKPFPTKVSGGVDNAEEDSSMASLSCGVNRSDDKEWESWDGQVKLSTPILVEVKVCNYSCMKEEETTDLLNATPDNSFALPSANSVVLVEFGNCRVSDTGLTAGNASSVVSDERSDDMGAEKSRDAHVIEPGMETSQCGELKLGDSFVVVNSCELRSVCLTLEKRQSYKNKFREFFTSKMKSAKEQEYEQQATGYEDLDAGLNQEEEESPSPSKLTRKLETADHDFYESDWEII